MKIVAISPYSTPVVRSEMEVMLLFAKHGRTDPLGDCYGAWWKVGGQPVELRALEALIDKGVLIDERPNGYNRTGVVFRPSRPRTCP